ncbi:MAG: hypothetical protein L5655_11730, partial [Thermosediminibacteraceae bacterium]|nr:hypothetical protein [Thermosediminibacteraceae bacterium]
ITEGINVVGSLAATRGDVAKMVDNALEVPLMEQVSWGTYPEYKEVDKTLLKDKLGVEVVVAKLVEFDDEDKEAAVKAEDEDGEFEIDKEYKYVEGIDFTGMEDAVFKLWVKNGTIIKAELESEVVYDFVAEITDKYVKLEVKDKKYDTADDFRDTPYNLGKNDFGKFVIYDGDVIAVEKIVLKDVTDAMITEVTEDYVAYFKGTGSERKFRVEDAESMLVIIDGAKSTYEALKPGMVFYANEDNDDIVILASSKKVEGKLERVKTTEVRIDGKYYDLAGTFYYSLDNGDNYKGDKNLDELLGEEVEAYLDAHGDILYIVGDVEETTTTFIGVALRDWTSDADYVRVFTEKGEVVTYETDVDIDSVVMDEVYEEAVYKFTLNKDGVITKAVPFNFVDVTSPKFNDDYDYIEGNVAGVTKKFYIGDDTLILNFEDPTDPEIVKWDDIKGNDEVGGLVLKIAVDKVEAKVVLIMDGYDEIAESDVYYGWIEDLYKIDKNTYEAVVYNGEEEITVKIDKDNLGSADVNMFFAYKLLADGTAKVLDVADFDSWSGTFEEGQLTVIDEVYTEDGYIKLDDDNYLKVDKNAVVYELTFDDDELDSAERAEFADVDEGDKAWIFKIGDIVKAIFFKRQ